MANKELGTWGRVFIFAQRSDRTTEVFTARSGRIDSSGDQSELVLTDVLATKFPSSNAQSQPEATATSTLRVIKSRTWSSVRIS